MTDEDIAEFGHLWSSGANEKYLLVDVSGDPGQLHRCLIYSKVTKTVKRISDDTLAIKVKQKMLEAGVLIVGSFPQ